MNVLDKLVDPCCRVDFSARNKQHALEQMANLAVQAPLMRGFDKAEVLKHLQEREEAVSTGLGGGFAIPHCRLDGLDDFVVFILVAPKGVGFEALDDKKVHVFVVVFAPAGQDEDHLRLLASISRMLARGRFVKELSEIHSTDVLHEVIARAVVEEEAPKVALQGPKKLLFIVLFYESDLESVLEFLIDQGIEGATVADAKNMSSYVSAMPLFAGFLSFMREDQAAAKTIMTVIDAGIERALVRGIEQITGDLDTRQGSMVISLDVSFSKGSLKMI